MKIKHLLPAFLASYACIGSAQNLTAFDGPYLGISAGWNQTSVSEGDINWSAPSPATPVTASGGQNSSASGGIVGINYGFNYRMKNLVLGGELSASMLGGTANGYAATTYPGNGALGSLSSTTQIKSLFAAKPKVGYVIDDNKTMLYGIAGVVVGEIKRTITQNPGDVVLLNEGASVSNTKSNQFGYTLGAGAERMISKQLSIKFELNYVNLGNANFTYTGPLTPVTATMTQNVKVTNMATTLGLNYKF